MLISQFYGCFFFFFQTTSARRPFSSDIAHVGLTASCCFPGYQLYKHRESYTLLSFHNNLSDSQHLYNMQPFELPPPELDVKGKWLPQEPMWLMKLLSTKEIVPMKTNKKQQQQLIYRSLVDIAHSCWSYKYNFLILCNQK